MSQQASGQWPSVAVVLVNWNGWRDCIECLDSAFAQDYPGRVHFILVDNDSADDSVGHLQTWCDAPQFDASWRAFDGVMHQTADPSRLGSQPIAMRLLDGPAPVADLGADGSMLTVVRSGGNLGFAGGNNVGLSVASACGFDFYWLLNTDTVVDRHALRHLVARAQQSDSVGMVGSTLRYYYNPGLVQAMGGGRLHLRNMLVTLMGADEVIGKVPVDPCAVESESDYVMGASMLVTSRFVRDIGPMQDDYFLYYEELDWAMRAKGRFELAYAPQSHVFHKVGGSSSQVVSEFAMNLMYRNKITFVSRFLPEYLPRTVWFLFVEMLRHVYRRRWMPAKLIARTLLDVRSLAKRGRLNA